ASSPALPALDFLPFFAAFSPPAAASAGAAPSSAFFSFLPFFAVGSFFSAAGWSPVWAASAMLPGDALANPGVRERTDEVLMTISFAAVGRFRDPAARGLAAALMPPLTIENHSRSYAGP